MQPRLEVPVWAMTKEQLDNYYRYQAKDLDSEIANLQEKKGSHPIDTCFWFLVLVQSAVLLFVLIMHL